MSTDQVAPVPLKKPLVRLRELIAVTVLALVPVAAKIISYPDYPGSDDSFIHLSVVDHIYAGNGWGVVAGHPVNLSSSPLYTLLLLALHPFGGIELAQVASGICTTVAMLLTYLTAKHLTRSVPVSLCALAVAAADVQLWRWTGTVMETTLAFALAVAVVYAVYRSGPFPSRLALTGIGALIGAATLTRFEIGMLLPLAALHLWTAERRAPASRLLWLLPGFSVVLAPWLVFATTVFGSPLPTTFAAKTSALAALDAGVAGDIAATVVSGFGPALLVVVVGAVAAARAGCLRGVIMANVISFAWPLALFGFYYLKVPYLQSPARYCLPGLATIPIAVVALVAAIPWLRSQVVLVSIAAVGAAVAVVANVLVVAPTLRGFNTNYRPAMTEAAAFLRAHCDGTGPVLAYVDIGILTDQGTGRCGVADGGALASPELRGLSLDAMISSTEPQFVVQSIGSSSGELLPTHPDLRLVLARPYLSHGVASAGQTDWLNIYAVDPHS